MMENKWKLIGPIVQLLFGILAIVSFIILIVNGEDIMKWIVTLLLAISFVILGIIGLINYKKQR